MNTASMADTFVPTRFPKRTKSVRLHIEFENEPDKMTTEEFWNFCQENHKIRAELTEEGDVIIMPPTGWETSNENADLNAQLFNWAKKDKRGATADSNGGFIFSNGAVRSPDASWVLKSRLEKFLTDELKKFLPLCPDFVVEITSPSDNLSETQEKMVEYMENGAQFGWLIHSKTKQVFVYRPNEEVEILENPTAVSGEILLTGFHLDLTEIW